MEGAVQVWAPPSAVLPGPRGPGSECVLAAGQVLLSPRPATFNPATLRAHRRPLRKLTALEPELPGDPAVGPAAAAL